MKFSLIILDGPSSSQSSNTALEFAKAAVATDHELFRVFFASDGVLHGSTLNTPPQDELNIAQAWQDFIRLHDVDAVVCVAASLRRGLLNEQEAQRYQKPADNLSDTMELSGLGQLIEATLSSDRVLTFGN
ncbi:MAG: sulfurtransferase complex subunit TusD [Gammaproteobacteria bacterium]|nr:MAG: sulfurtransferase complex subunit TusD [Gammaproteobacteria bacterium]